MSSTVDFYHALKVATVATKNAAATLQIYATNRNILVVDRKARNDLVSQADHESENTILEILKTETPDFGIIAEESGSCNGEADFTWFIDPLDGTTNYLNGIPHYAVSIGLVAKAGVVLNLGQAPLTQDTPIIGVVYDPSRQEMFTAVYNDGCWLNDHRITCSQTATLGKSLLATGVPFRDFSFEKSYMAMFDKAMHNTLGIRRMGAAALDLAWVACGRYEAYWEMGLEPWDICAGTLLVREAGGFAKDLYGINSWPKSGHIIAANEFVYQDFYALLSPHIQANNEHQ